MLDFMIPTCSRDLEQARLLLRSLDTFADRDTIGRVVLVAVDEPGFLPRMRLLTTPALRSRMDWVRYEDLNVSASALSRYGGWHLQQLVKLAFARHARSDFYVVLDSKNIVLRPFVLKDLVQGGRAPWVLENAALHSRWWRASARLLRHPTFDLHASRRALSSATPVLMHTATVRKMMEWVENAYDASFERTFLRYPRWPGSGRATEFCSYFTYLDREQRRDELHFESPGLHDTCTQIWNVHSAAERRERLTRLLTDKPVGLFTGIHRAIWQELNNELRQQLTALATGAHTARNEVPARILRPAS